MQKRVNSVQKRVNSVQKRVNSVQRKKQIRHSDWSIIKETHRKPIKCEPWMSHQNLKIFERNNGVLNRFSFATAAQKQLKKQKHCMCASKILSILAFSDLFFM